MEQVPLPQPHILLGALSVDLHPLEADVLLGQGAGEQGEGLGQPAVQPLPGVVFPDGKLFHNPPRCDQMSRQYTTKSRGMEERGGGLAALREKNLIFSEKTI